MVSVSSSSVASSLIASAASSISSVALGARMCTPSISPNFGPARTFIMPPVQPATRLRPLALVGKRPTMYSMPSSLGALLGVADARYLGADIGAGGVMSASKPASPPMAFSAAASPIAMAAWASMSRRSPVADGVNALDAGLEVRVHLYEAVLHGYPGLFEAQRL